jgi:poly(A) polymerase
LASEALDLLLRWGALGLWLPEVASMDGLHASAPPERPHKDLWAHTRQVLAQCPPEPDLRWVALCHDIGKPATRAFGPDGVTFWRHEAVGAWLFTGLAARLGMAAGRVERIAFVIGHHARTNQFEDGWSDRALRRLRRECGPWLDDMIAFSRADWSTRRTARVRVIQAGLDRLEARLDALDAPATDLAPAGLAAELLARTGEPPGPWVGEALGWARDALATGRVRQRSPVALAQAVLAARDAWGPQKG